jgi:preprotein translocase subunit SecA
LLQVTIATNLAGRGTDILLGGNPKGLVGQLLEGKLLAELAPGGRPEAPGQQSPGSNRKRVARRVAARVLRLPAGFQIVEAAPGLLSYLHAFATGPSYTPIQGARL